MNKVIKLGMLFNEGNVPDFGSIQMKSHNTNTYYLLAQDIPKLNSMLTKAVARSYLPESESFNVPTGALAFVVDHKTALSGQIYAYHRGQDHWYEFNIRSDLKLLDFMWNRHERILRETKTISGTPPLTFKSNGRPLKNYRIYGNTVNGESVGDLVTEGEHAGEYCVPVTITNGSDTQTTNIYLSEQIRKVGDEMEYIDYKEQNQHRVRNNLFYGDWTQGSVINNGSIDNATTTRIKTIIPVMPSHTYTIRTNLLIRIIYAYHDTTDFSGRVSVLVDSENGKDYAVITIPDNANLIAVSLKKSDNSNVTPSDVEWTMLNLGSEPLPYEPYIENTELNVFLPPLPTFSGTNTLSILTETQSTRVEIK